MKERILIGETVDYEIKRQISNAQRQFQDHLRGVYDTSGLVVRFVELNDFEDIFKGGKKTLQKYEDYLKNTLEGLKNPKPIYHFNEGMPHWIKDFKRGLFEIKQAYDVLTGIIPKDAITIVSNDKTYLANLNQAKITESIQEKTRVYIETPEQKELYDLCNQLCDISDKIIEMQKKPTYTMPEPLSMFMYRDEFGENRKTVINPNNLINYFKNL